MNLNELENIANREKLTIVNYKMNPKARILDNFIFMNYSNIDTFTEEKCLLSEELGHYYYSAFYTFSSSPTDISRAEYKALKWSYNVLIPYEDLKLAIKNGIDDIYLLAEYFEVTVEYMASAIKFYEEKYGYIY